MAEYVPLSEAELQAIEARFAKATPGPWTHDTSYDSSMVWGVGVSITGAPVRTGVCRDVCEDDAEFIAAARQDMARLVAEVRALRREDDRLVRLVVALDKVPNPCCGCCDGDSAFNELRRELIAIATGPRVLPAPPEPRAEGGL